MFAAEELTIATPVADDDLGEDPEVPILHTNVYYPEVVPIKQDVDKSQEAFPDLWALLLFTINVFVVIYFASHDGIPAAQKSINDNNPHAVPDSSTPFTHADVLSIFRILVILLFVAGALSILWLAVMIRFGKQLIKITIILSAAFSVALACAAFSAGPQFVGLGCVWLLLGCINICYYFCVQRRIAFASANLEVACKAIQAHPGVIVVGFTCMVVQLIWLMLWMLAVLGLFKDSNDQSNRGKDCNNGISGDNDCTIRAPQAQVFLLLLSLYWGQQVIKNISHTTTAGSVASWWFSQNNSSPTLNSLHRTLTTSLGPICLGSLLVAIVKALREMAREARKRSRGNGAALCVVECLLSCLESAMEWVTSWAFVYVGRCCRRRRSPPKRAHACNTTRATHPLTRLAPRSRSAGVYGLSFRSAGSRVWELFKQRGWSAIINDDLVSTVLSLGSLVVGSLTAGAGVLLVLGADAVAGVSFTADAHTAACAIAGRIA
jgi:hypothetical protein